MANRLVALGVLGAAAVISLLPAMAVAGQAPEPQNSCLSDDPARFWRCAQQTAAKFSPPRTADGKPDLSGYWRHTTEAKENLEEPWDDATRVGVRARARDSKVPPGPGKSLVVDPPDGKLPLQPWAVTQRRENAAKYIDQNVHCFLSGAVRHMYEAPAYQIIQTPEYIAIPSEESHASRIITLANRPHLGKSILLWQGDARGRWDGNTLVVESTNHNGRVFLDRRGTFYTDSAILTERFTMLDLNTIAYEGTVNDPLVYTRPFTIAFMLSRHATRGFEIWEDSCFEGEADTDRLYRLGLRMYPGITSRDVPAIKARQASER